MGVNPMTVDYTDLKAVMSLAKSLGPKFVVIKHATQDNYNIVHRVRTDLYQPSEVVTCK